MVLAVYEAIKAYLGSGGMPTGLFFSLITGSVCFSLDTVVKLFRENEKNYKVLDKTGGQSGDILMKNFDVLSEICRLLGQLEEAVQTLEDATENNVVTQEDLIKLGFDCSKSASDKLVKNCDILLKSLHSFSLEEKCVDKPGAVKDKSE